VASSSSDSTPEDRAGNSARFRFAWPAACLLLALMALLAWGAAGRESVTFDEVAHLGAGVSYLQKLDLRLNEEHPPLAKILAAAPLVLRGVYADYDHVTWTNSFKFLPNAFLGEWIFGEWLLARWNDPARTLAWARFPMLLLTLVLGGMVFVYGRRLGGDWGGLLALSAYASAPVFIAFGPLVLTDIPVTLFCLATLWQFAELWRKPSRRAAVRFGLCLAAALLTKFSSGLLFFAFAAFAFSTRFLGVPGEAAGAPTRDKAELRAWRRARWRWTFKGVALAAAVVYCFYILFSLGQSTDALYLLGHGGVWVPMRRLLMPPWLYLRGLLLFALMSVRPTFILGHGYSHGVWFYFPVLMVLKSPLGFLGLLALLLGLAVARRRRLRTLSGIPPALAFHWRVIWVSLVVFTAACLLSGMTISLRHFSVPIVLLMVMLALVPAMIQSLAKEARRWALVSAALAVFFAAASWVSVARAYPYFFPYFNELTLSHPVYWWASDSNVDWNQSLPEVRRFAEEHRLKSLLLSPYGETDPALTVPQARFWDCQQPQAQDAGQWAVVSSNLLLDAQNCAWVMHYPHQMLAGGSMWAIRLPSAIPDAGAPGGPPTPSQRKTFLGMPEDSRVSNIELFRHPDQLPSLSKRVEEQMREYFQKKHWPGT
jgi:Dolichyl-phosphate-mannose-protein mannosyltransferase